MIINAIDTTLPAATLAEIKAKINEAKDLMPFLVVLSAKQRKGGFKMSSSRFDFVSKVVIASQHYPAVVPSWVDLESLKNDYMLSNQLFGIESMLESLLAEVRDTRMQLGAEALKSSADVYALVHKSKDRIPGMQAVFDSLRASYPGRGKSKEKGVIISE